MCISAIAFALSLVKGMRACLLIVLFNVQEERVVLLGHGSVLVGCVVTEQQNIGQA